MKPLTRMSVYSVGFTALYANQTSIVECQYKAGQIIRFWMKWVVMLWPNFKRLGKISMALVEIQLLTTLSFLNNR